MIVFEDVEVIDERDGDLVCRVRGREVLVPAGEVGIDDRAVYRPGQRGRLVIPREVAVELGLLAPTAT